MKTKISLLTAAALIVGCSSLSKNTSTVQNEYPSRTVVSQPSTVVIAQPVSNKTASSPKEAAAVCENDEMRSQAVDGNDYNDSVRLMVVHDTEGSSKLLSEIEINCRDYFLRKSLSPAQPSLVRASAPTVARQQEVIRRSSKSSRYTYIVQKGDTVWNIAREHCTTVKDVTNLNDLGRGNILDIGQRLKLPDVNCS